ncbi:MAG: coproporphyrinogen dehydrogenase HemZ [Clostridia bacterium]|nr:coproporphyrinogen dehydrogenase HemZ [Clostridia bacterium]
MKYRIIGHDRLTAVQDMLIALLPDEKHMPDDLEGGDLCISTLERTDGWVVAAASVSRGDKTTCGECREREQSGEEGKRIVSYAVKTALYRAIVQHLESEPVWGSLTGVKPAKPARVYMQQGNSIADTEKWLRDRYFVSPDRAELCIAAAEAALETERKLRPDEVQLYAGIPFCPSKCAYCSFVSNDMVRWGHLIEPYHRALLREVEAAGVMLSRENRRIGSVYIGGGTPTTLSAQQLDELIKAIRSSFDLSACREFTVEAGRPETITCDKLEVLAHNGVSRISINPQTMNDQVLENVGRKHTVADIINAYSMARRAGDFDINMDLIAGLPGDNGDSLLNSVRRVVELDPENITVHCLARKKGAPMRFGKRGELTRSELDACYEVIEKAGYKPYYLYRQKYSAGGLENIGFCKNDKKSHYNICMMEEIGDVVALGAGGISKLCSEQGQKIVRICNPKYPIEYVERADSIVNKKLDITL